MNALMTIEQLNKPQLALEIPAASELSLSSVFIDMRRVHTRNLLRCGATRGVYFLHCAATGLVKVGTSEDVLKRVGEIQRMSPVPLLFLGSVPGGVAEESRYHRLFGAVRAHGEWFLFTERVRAVILRDLERGAAISREECRAHTTSRRRGRTG